jgi:hypothetical protein
MYDIQKQQGVLLWPEVQVKALSYHTVVAAPGHVAFGDLLKPRSDEVARRQLKASTRMSHTSVMRIRQEVFVPLKYLLHNQES